MTNIDPERIAELTDRLEQELTDRTPRSMEIFQRARLVMPGGVPSSFQEREPHPIYVSGGSGSKVTDVDGNEYIDFHNGFGVMVVGHAHPAVVAAIAKCARLGTHFAAPNETSVRVAEELARRFRLPKVRFCNSGTEATMDAVHLARGFTGKDCIVKIEGTYHGHHDAVMVSVKPPPDKLGPLDAPASNPFSGGIPRAETNLTLVVPFNDPDALERLLSARDDIAGVIIEPIMLNIGVVMPKPGYLEAVREITARHGVVLIFDEVKTGITIAAGGAVEYFGVVPDIVCLAKAIGGGVPTGAVLGTEAIMATISEGKVKQLGTFNGNPLSMAAAEATLFEVMTPEAYKRLGEAAERIEGGCREVVDRYGLPAYVVGAGAKGCVMFSEETITDYRSYMAHFRDDLNNLGWLFHMNNGVFMTPGGDEQWTLSVAHSDADLDHYAGVFEEFAKSVTAS
ncbi:MAG: aspartate aminotransferase family protein [Acidimicrobiia bacterium]